MRLVATNELSSSGTSIIEPVSWFPNLWLPEPAATALTFDGAVSNHISLTLLEVSFFGFLTLLVVKTTPRSSAKDLEMFLLDFSDDASLRKVRILIVLKYSVGILASMNNIASLEEFSNLFAGDDFTRQTL